jgi:uncharacterized protein YbaR (Trm112 family)
MELQVVSHNTVDAAGLVQPLQMRREERDSTGNLIMTLQDIGLSDTVRYYRTSTGIPMFARVDVVVAVTGLSSASAGKYIYKISFCTYLYVQKILLHLFICPEDPSALICMSRRSFCTYLYIQKILLHLFVCPEDPSALIYISRRSFCTYLYVRKILLHLFVCPEDPSALICMSRRSFCTYLYVRKILLHLFVCPEDPSALICKN